MVRDTISMSDDSFFESFTSSVKVINSCLDEVYFVKNTFFDHVYASQKILDWAGVVSVNQLNQKKNAILLEADTSAKRQLIENIRQYEIIKQMRKSINVAEVINLKGKLIIDLWHLTPIINPATNNFLGVYGVAQEFVYPNILSFLFRVNNIPLPKRVNYIFSHTLTKKQDMVLFLYLCRFSNTEIATYMTKLGHKISPGRVNKHLANLKIIFDAQSKDQLIEFGLRYYTNSKIPDAFLTETSLILDEL